MYFTKLNKLHLFLGQRTDKGLKISKSDLDIFKAAAAVIEKLSPRVLRIKVISIVLLAKTACICASIKNAGLAN